MILETAFAEDLLAVEADEMAGLRRRDPAAVAFMVDRYQHRLYRYLVRLVGPGAAADDLYQQTWLNVVRQLDRYDTVRSFESWLFTIAHNAAMDLLRRKKGESLDDEVGEWPAGGSDALSDLITAERAAILASEVDSLPALFREAVTLRFEEGMKLEEIAEVTGVPVATAKSRIRRALESLRRNIGRHWRKEDLL